MTRAALAVLGSIVIAGGQLVPRLDRATVDPRIQTLGAKFGRASRRLPA